MQAVSSQVFDSLFGLLTLMATGVAVLVFGWLVYAMVRFRARPGAPEPPDAPVAGHLPAERGNRKVELTWTVGPSILVVIIALASAGPLLQLDNPPVSPPPLVIQVNAQQFSWEFVYPEGFKLSGNLTVPAGKPVLLMVASRDVIHSFFIPDFKFKMDAIPGTVNRVWFQADKAGEYPAQCAEFCGLGHAFMKARVEVLEPADFDAWRAQRAGGR